MRMTSPGIRLAQVKEEARGLGEDARIRRGLRGPHRDVRLPGWRAVEGPEHGADRSRIRIRLIVNKLVYRIGEPAPAATSSCSTIRSTRRKSFVKACDRRRGATRCASSTARVYVNDIPLKDDYVLSDYRSHDDWGRR